MFLVFGNKQHKHAVEHSQQKLLLKKFLRLKKKAVVFVKWPDFKFQKGFRPVGSYEVKDALFKPGSEPVIEYLNPANGSEISMKFNKKGTGTAKIVAKRGGESGNIIYDMKKNEARLNAVLVYFVA